MSVLLSSSNEWYPIIEIEDEGTLEGHFVRRVDIPVATVERWKKAFTDFRAVQEEMSEAFGDD